MQAFDQRYPASLISMGNLAPIYRNRGRWNEAERLEMKVMESRKSQLGLVHPDPLTSVPWHSVRLSRWRPRSLITLQKLGSDSRTGLLSENIMDHSVRQTSF